MIDLRLDEAKRIVEEKGYKKVLVLLPAGLMPKATDFDFIPEPVFSGPCFGACDVPSFDGDAIFNFGHSRPLKWPQYPDNVHFFEVQVKRPIPNFVPSFEKVGLVYVIQFKNLVQEYASYLESKGKTVVLGGLPDFMATHPGQITGCDVGAARKVIEKVDGFVVACDGHFHSSAVALLGKPTFNWEGEESRAPKFPIAALFVAKTVGLLVGTKPGQNYSEQARDIKQKLEKQGKTVIWVEGDSFSPELANFDVDFWVVAACPRLAEDSWLKPAAPLSEVSKFV